MRWIAIPFASYFILMLYATVMSQLYGYDWIRQHPTVMTEYIIAMCVYTLCLLGHTVYKKKIGVDNNQ